MADDQEKTEEPTSKRLEEAREDGNVPKSIEVAGWIGLLVAALVVIALFNYSIHRIEHLFYYYGSLYQRHLSPTIVMDIMIVTARELALILLPMTIPIMIAGIAGHVAQFGFLFTTKPLMPNFEKIDPIKGFGNLFSIKKLLEGAKIILKVSVSFGVGFWLFWLYIKQLPTVALFGIGDQMRWLGEKSIAIAFLMLLVFALFAAIDLFITRFQYFDSLKMSKQEIKDEYKNMEGDPHVKGRIRQIQMQMAKKRMLSEVPKASVVVTNPTHYAVAIKYKTNEDNAPKVVASGVDFLAIRIKEIAREHHIPIYEDPPLARSLYKEVKVDSEIPSKLYQAVAHVLAWVMKANNKNL